MISPVIPMLNVPNIRAALKAAGLGSAILGPLLVKLRGEPSLFNTLAATAVSVLGGRFAYRRSLGKLTVVVQEKMEPQINADERR